MGTHLSHATRFTIITLLLAAPAVSQAIHVDAAATGSGTGDSWADAYTDLQDALAAVSQGDIWVSRGTYHPGSPGERLATFQLISGVRIFGGFNGTETSLAQRDVGANPTILSGDIDDDDTYGAGLNWWQFGWTGSANNSYHVVTGTGADASAVLDGVTILAGVGSDPALKGGGGLLVLGGSPTFRQCTFRYNAIGFGSSAYLAECNSVFEQCVIRDGYTCNCGAGGWTSGILATDGSDVSFIDCEFANHYYVSSQGQGRGAALNIDFGSRGTLLRCRIVGNQTGNFYPAGGGTAYGAGVNAHGDVVVDQCEFLDNFAHAGAGLTAWADARVSNSLFARNEAVPHDNGPGFEDGNYGAGFLTVGFGNPTVEVINCTFVDNNCEKGAGLALYGSGIATIRNTIIYDNYADPPKPGEDPVWILKQNIVGDYDVANSCVEGLLQTEPGEDPPDPANFPGCIDTDPLVISLGSQDYRLQGGSPCIDSGDNGAVTPGALDLDGKLRQFDDPATPDTGLGMAPLVDMGAYEFGSISGASPWVDLGGGTSGIAGQPMLMGTGTLLAGSTASVTLTHASSGALLLTWISFAPVPFQALGGTVHAFPYSSQLVLAADSAGSFVGATAWPSGIPAGTQVWFQFLVQDGSSIHGITLSNGLRATTP